MSGEDRPPEGNNSRPSKFKEVDYDGPNTTYPGSPIRSTSSSPPVEIQQKSDISSKQKQEIESRNARAINKRTTIKSSRTQSMSTFKSIWSINGFLHPWLYTHSRLLFNSRIIRWFGRQSPFILVFVELILMAIIGLSGIKFTFLDRWEEYLEEWRWYTLWKGYKLGAWGYCDSRWVNLGWIMLSFSFVPRGSDAKPSHQDYSVGLCLVFIERWEGCWSFKWGSMRHETFLWDTYSRRRYLAFIENNIWNIIISWSRYVVPKIIPVSISWCSFLRFMPFWLFQIKIILLIQIRWFDITLVSNMDPLDSIFFIPIWLFNMFMYLWRMLRE